MGVRIEEVEKEARSTGEAFLPLWSGDGARVGVSGTRVGDSVLLVVEVRVRLLPLGERVEVGSLSRSLDTLRRLVEARFTLFHYNDGWVVGHAPTLPGTIEAVVERAIQAVGALG